jgi:hypothetical protein
MSARLLLRPGIGGMAIRFTVSYRPPWVPGILVGDLAALLRPRLHRAWFTTVPLLSAAPILVLPALRYRSIRTALLP